VCGVPELFRGVLPHVLNVEVGIAVLARNFNMKAFLADHLLAAGYIRILRSDAGKQFIRRVAPRGRASRDLLEKDPPFCMQVGRLAIQRIIEGYGYDLTPTDVIDAYQHFMAAAQKLDVAAQARNDVLAMATKAKQSGAAFSDTLIRACSPGPQVKATVYLQREESLSEI